MRWNHQPKEKTMNEWIVLIGAILFRAFECYKKVGKFDLKAILKEFFQIS
jgi:hypothetical protein